MRPYSPTRVLRGTHFPLPSFPTLAAYLLATNLRLVMVRLNSKPPISSLGIGGQDMDGLLVVKARRSEARH